ncbi:hypothetical protein CTA1_6053, partial [Colletotrichum tanaceti]
AVRRVRPQRSRHGGGTPVILFDRDPVTTESPSSNYRVSASLSGGN